MMYACGMRGHRKIIFTEHSSSIVFLAAVFSQRSARVGLFHLTIIQLAKWKHVSTLEGVR